jgi:hypothetical protein
MQEQYIETSRYGTKKYFKDKAKTILHREDGPAVEYSNGERAWYVDGKLHRLDGPAIEHADGSKSWLVDGKYHREDGPAVEWADGSKAWYVNDVFIFEVDGSGQLVVRMQ